MHQSPFYLWSYWQIPLDVHAWWDGIGDRHSQFMRNSPSMKYLN